MQLYLFLVWRSIVTAYTREQAMNVCVCSLPTLIYKGPNLVNSEYFCLSIIGL